MPYSSASAGREVKVSEVAAEVATIKGTVIGIRIPVPGAKVNLNTERVAYTDDAGRFILENVSTGSYTLTVKHWLFKDYSETVEVTEAKVYTLEIKLSVKTAVIIGAILVSVVTGGVALVSVRRKKS